MNRHLRTLHEVMGAVRIINETTFTWFGAPSDPFPSGLRSAVQPEVRRAYLVAALSDRIYRDAYCPGSPRPVSSDEQFPNTADGLGARIEAANAGTGSRDSGWTVVEVGVTAETPAPGAAGNALRHRIGVSARGLRLWVLPEECLWPHADAPAVGDRIEVRLPRGSYAVSPGYYSAFGDVPLNLRDEDQLIRVYFAVRPDSAPQAMRLLTERLNHGGVPFRLKMLRDAASYARRDTAVLYLSAADVEPAAEAVAFAVAELSGSLTAGVPAFTLEAAPGVGLAEEPEARSSFGEHRSALLAEGLVRAAEQGLSSGTSEERLALLRQPWHEASISLEQPHLNLSSDGTAIETLNRAIRGALVEAGGQSTPAVRYAVHLVSDRAASVCPPNDPADDVQIARDIGSKLVADAVWHENNCTWLAMVPTSDGLGKPALSFGSIGSSLYDGGAGVGLFLAMLGTVTQLPGVEETAAAAARHALDSLAGVPGGGLYTGWAGTALAALLTGLVAENDALIDTAVASVHQRLGVDGAETDLLSGQAGTALALLCFGRLTGEQAFIREAERIGLRLLQSSRISDRGQSWPNLAGGDSPDLTGLSHGASGMGATFVELAAATGDQRFADAARGAFRYERSWYSAELHNWPDLRDAHANGAPEVEHPFLAQWCHGAPGIGLARLRAADVLGDEVLRQEAMAALRTTIAATEAALDNPGFSFSLCHGLTGNADILLDGIEAARSGSGGPLAEQEISRAEDLLGQISLRGRARHGEGRLPWPCGIPIPGIVVPSLMLGTAGIGYHYLRQAFPGVLPSVMLPNPDSLARWVLGRQSVPGAAHPDRLLKGNFS